ncbi:Sec63 complex subunit [Saccharomycopsis crataegensis]|uniref:Translocation protein SEC62 n=1 Tax=Saccharomycopsis crataegensis TaxID=43959 RepID=A0AAV5QFX9_9ASCO|nr:Sec63 complex subunit [Saccharomycopsis crataegensis]
MSSPAKPPQNPQAIAIAKAIRHNPLLKQRQGLLNPVKKIDFFRYKRVIRALLSTEYKSKQQRSPILPVIANEQDAMKYFIEVIKAGLVYPVNKLEVSVAREKNLPVERGFPNLEIDPKATLQPDEYYLWNYEIPNPYALLYGVLFLAAVFGLILFPLWPYKLRLGVWYLSMGCLGLLAGFFAMALVRLVIFCATYPILSPGFWLFPNLFADCGFFESFVPLYGWGNEVLDPKSAKLQEWKQKKVQKAAKKEKKSKEEEAPSGKEILPSSDKKVTTTGRKVLLEEVEE